MDPPIPSTIGVGAGVEVLVLGVRVHVAVGYSISETSFWEAIRAPVVGAVGVYALHPLHNTLFFEFLMRLPAIPSASNLCFPLPLASFPCRRYRISRCVCRGLRCRTSTPADGEVSGIISLATSPSMCRTTLGVTPIPIHPAGAGVGGETPLRVGGTVVVLDHVRAKITKTALFTLRQLRTRPRTFRSVCNLCFPFVLTTIARVRQRISRCVCCLRRCSTTAANGWV